MTWTKEDVLHLLNSYVDSAAIGVALELELFWMLDKKSRNANDIAHELGIPRMRCHFWLEHLKNLGFLDRVEDGYVTSSWTLEAVVDAYSRETWSLLAQEAREKLPTIQDLALHIGDQVSTLSTRGLTPMDYVTQMKTDFERARRFTRMLYEIHQPLAEELAVSLDMSGVKRLMDLGGGSGVISFALLRRYSEISATIVDVANVCKAGMEIAMEESVGPRVTYFPADFIHDDLPKGFDIILECDVGIYGESLFKKLWTSLNPNGSLIIIDQVRRIETGSSYPSKAQSAFDFMASLGNPSYCTITASDIIDQLRRVGFQNVSEDPMTGNMTIIKAQKTQRAAN
ncbi:MAG: methyltransferase [Candidatus Thorarchaeota archaeon]|jgi:methylase of polypeptide subunit release factors